MSIRVYLNVSGLQVQKHPHGSHYVTILVEGVEVQERLFYENGEFFLIPNNAHPNIPKVLGKCVRCVTSQESILVNEATERLEGRYRSRSGKVTATVTREEGMDRRTVNIRATSLKSWQTFRNALLYGRPKTIDLPKAA